jgi:hypothetical protein
LNRCSLGLLYLNRAIAYYAVQLIGYIVVILSLGPLVMSYLLLVHCFHLLFH